MYNIKRSIGIHPSILESERGAGGYAQICDFYSQIGN